MTQQEAQQQAFLIEVSQESGGDYHSGVAQEHDQQNAVVGLHARQKDHH